MVGLARCEAQLTPNQILSHGSAFGALSDHDIQVSQSTLLWLLTGGTATPASILSSGSAFGALSDQQIQICIAQLLNQLASSGLTNSVSVNGAFYTNLTAAKNAATSGQTIFVYPGVYNENNLSKPGVNWFWYPGSSNYWICQSVGFPDAYGFYDDRATGATTNRVYGKGDFYFSCGTNANGSCHGNTNAVGAVVTTNANTDIVVEGHNLGFDFWGDCDGVIINGQTANPAALYVSRARRAEFTFYEVLSPGIDTTQNSVAPLPMGLYWEAGETYLTFTHMGRFSPYGIWGNGAAQGDQNMWISGAFCESKVYVSTITSTHDPNFKNWFQFKELLVPGNCVSVIGGKCYLQAEKIGSVSNNIGGASVPAATVLDVSVGELWVNAQKISAGKSGSFVNFTGGSNWVSTMQYEETVAPGALGMAVGWNLSGGTNTFFGGNAVLTCVGINHSGGLNVFNNLTINTGLSNKPPVLISASGLHLKGCTLIVTNSVADPMTNCITATSGKTLGVYWSAANRTNNVNITMSPNAGLTVDSGVQ